MYYNNIPHNNNDRQFFLPFLLGGLAGAGIVGVSRPRPVFVNSPGGYPPPQYGIPYPPPYRPYNSGYYNYQSGGFY